MHLATIDWIILISFLFLSIGIGLYFRSNASKSLSDYFLGGRNLPWYIAGMSMVATTFAADTPLWVTEKIAQHGISGNWLWWNMLIGGMLTTFFFAKFWRRANVVTELEFIELRYSGAPAKFLRGFKSIYMGIFLNAIIIGWVNLALMSILEVFFEIPKDYTIWYAAIAMLFVAAYSSLAGLKGIAITDTIQFIIAMVGTTLLAIIVLNSEKIGGIAGLKEKLPAWRFNFFPSMEGSNTSGSTYVLTLGAFLSFGLVQWWASWYPGSEPGGGGYVSQRMMSAKDEKHSLVATLFFYVAHYCLRPWPWIIVGLCALVLYPDLTPENSKNGFVLIMRDYLQDGGKGILLVAFLGAYMSTISTQLNWGASYLTNDLYKRFIRKEENFESPEKAGKHYVNIGRLSTILIMAIAFFATTQMTTLDSAAKFLIACGAGLGAVLILRWYWWRINAWSEISATLAPFVGYTISKYILAKHFGAGFEKNEGVLLCTALFTTISWIVITFITKPTNDHTLKEFYERVKPDGWWRPVTQRLNIASKPSNIFTLIICWLSSVVLVYSTLFASGYFIFEYWNNFYYSLISMVTSGLILYLGIKKSKVLS